MSQPWQESVVFTLLLVNALVAIELLASLVAGKRVYSLAGTLTNVAAYTIYLIIAAVYGYLAYLTMSYVQLALTIPRLHIGWAYWPLLILAEDFCFYWFHRLSHKIGILWMAHVVHHSSHEFNLSVGLRQTWLPFLGILFWLPLAFMGFAPEHILLVQAASLSYQFFMHTQVINLPGFWGWIFNTPSHHRVHHGMNAEYIDRNFAGVFILWDRLFRTFEPERAPVRFGIHECVGCVWCCFVQLWGPVQFGKNLFTRAEISDDKDVYSLQKTSVILSAIFLLVSIIAFAIVLRNPRWFI